MMRRAILSLLLGLALNLPVARAEDVPEADVVSVDSPAFSLPLRDPAAPDLLRAEAELKRGRPLQALAIIRAVLKVQPEHGQARFMASTALLQLGREKEARKVLEALVQQYPRSYSFKNNLAWLLATAHDPAVRDPSRAVHLAQDALLEAPGAFHVWSTLAEAHYRAGTYDRAVRAAEQALAMASEQKADADNLQTYSDQVLKCRDAANVFTLVE